MTRRILMDPSFAVLLKELREERRLSLRRLGQKVHCSHGYLWDLESGNKNPSAALAAQLDAVLNAGGRLSALVCERTSNGRDLVAHHSRQGSLPPGLEFAPDWRRGVEVATRLWADDVTRGSQGRDLGLDATAFLAPVMRWLISPGDERPSGSGERLVGEPDVETVRRITAVYRGLDNQYGGGHIRESLVLFLDSEVAGLLRGRYDALTGAALLSAAAEATQLAAWATYDVGMNGLAQQYMIQALRLSAAAGDRALGAEILAAMSHQAAYVGASTEAIDLARAAGRAAVEAGVAAIGAESAVLEAKGHAIGGDEASCATALDRAERALDRADRTRDPHWIGYFDEAYLAAKFGHCFATLGRGDLAQRFAARSLDMDGRRYARGRQFNLALLAVAHAQSGELEQASEFGVQAADATEGLQSRRARDYLADIADRLAPHTGVAAVRTFLDRVRDTVPQRD